ncbi:hypothetical protein AAZX31_12G051100 [Glycine max]|uniref:Uncharacterized protein n=2 Tax=Glycine subgen. Soja TaxID=1462606 RepID=I1LQF2_SOYBN|nr:uncharacterized protein LOC100800627 [Glycine max]XP_028194768.1 uncharacterized protein LOC114380058 [Glycine soja]XP_040863331.1 uncharacterized protein LOC100800627 [Glycine max]KAG4979622.1 hypothetical protein JHK85_033580 [Glycine max]KAG4985269.1 hypothetical protein JHK86_032960 [Glycine max]KAG5118454.1 hypothetical protein JHK82_032874 [Glycine max]KAG5139439.1 hypothetical protein JHK84_033207 [Glycine max]KAH1141732.1 hypothetical protein GYH30_032778 [Glycine max]|eukprot:XP_003540702.1 uncharacterized protein LOC100800627 [Glycine max]
MSLTGTVNDATATNSPCCCSEASGSGSCCGCSSNNSSTHICFKCDFNCDPLLTLENEDSKWISDSNPYGCSSAKPSSPLSTNGIHCDRSKDNIISVEHLLEIEDMQEFNVDEPLFWPFEAKLNWNYSEESWSPFCISPRKRVVFGSRSMTSRIKESKHKDPGIECSVTSEPSRITMSSKGSAEIVNSELNDEKVVLKSREDGNKLIFVDNLNEDHEPNYDLQLARGDFSLDQEPEIPIETLVGLKEFDGHEGLDSEFNGDVFMLEDSLLITHASECVVSKKDE